MGTQVRMHVVRLYGMEFERPGPRLRDYVRRVQGALAAALRACRMLTESEVEEPAATDVFHGLVAAAAQHRRPVISFNRGRVLRSAGPRRDRWCRVRTAIRIDGVYVDLVWAAGAKRSMSLSQPSQVRTTGRGDAGGSSSVRSGSPSGDALADNAIRRR
jgi:hypothetical protein